MRLLEHRGRHFRGQDCFSGSRFTSVFRFSRIETVKDSLFLAQQEENLSSFITNTGASYLSAYIGAPETKLAHLITDTFKPDGAPL